MTNISSTKSSFFVVVGVALVTVTKIIQMNKHAITDKHFFLDKNNLLYTVVTLCTMDALFFMLCKPSISSKLCKLMPAIFAYILVIYAYGCI